MRVLVTGGAGFIGSHICEEAIRRGHEVAVVDNLSGGKRANVPEGAALHVVDIRDAGALNEVFSTFRPEAVTHQAAQASVSISMREPLMDADVNVVGSLNVLEACSTHGCERFVFASTGGAIYGEVAAPERATVGRTPIPESPYAAAKLAVEGYLKFYRDRGVACNSLRYANVYGVRQDPHGEAGVVAIFCQRLRDGLPVQVNAMSSRGDRGCIRDYVHVSDVVRANLAALENSLAAETLNVGTGTETDTQTLLEQIASIAGVDAGLNFSDHRSGDVKRSVLDAAPFTDHFGAPATLADGLESTVAWFFGRRER